MRPASPSPPRAPAGAARPALRDLADDVLAIGRRAGLDAVGIATAEPFDDVRETLEARKAEGLHGGMHFTYGDPARSTDPSRSLPGARSLVVGARSYRRADPVPAGGGVPAGEVARYSWTDHYVPLRAALEAVAERLRTAGHSARVLVDDNALVDRAAAHRAGIGWWGKNANLLLPELGSWFVLGSVVTDAVLPPTASGPVADGCGPCTRCMPACPTGALVAPGVLDARRCLAWLLEAKGTFPWEHRVALGGRIYGCDECQEACPPNVVRIRKAPPPPAEPDAEPTLPLLDLLAMGDDELLARVARWYVPRRQPRYVRRNVLVALGNVADGGDERVVAAVSRALADADPLVRSHAVWCAARLGLDHLLVPLHAAASSGAEADADVLAELRRAHEVPRRAAVTV